MNITGLRVRAVRVPMQAPHTTASGVIKESPLVLTELLTDADITGRSIVFTYTALALGPTADLIRSFDELLRGQPVAPLLLEEFLAARFRLLGQQGLVGMAMAAVDMAAWDALAMAQRVPLYRLLGGDIKRVPVYGAVGFDGPRGCAEQAESWAKRGIRAVKAKIGYRSASDDIEVIRAMRRAAGDDLTVMVDYNQSLTPADAIARLRHLEEERLTWIEEPTLAHDYAGNAEIAREIRTPIQCGENWWGIGDLQKAFDAHASDYVMPDVMKIGGVTGWLRAAALAHARQVRVSNHLWPEISAHLLCVTPTAHWLEYADWWNPILQQPLKLKDGHTDLDDTPGSGVVFNEEAIRTMMPGLDA